MIDIDFVQILKKEWIFLYLKVIAPELTLKVPIIAIMKQVKLFDQDSMFDLETEVNQFLKDLSEQEDINVVDIRFFPFHQGETYGNSWTAMVIYEE